MLLKWKPLTVFDQMRPSTEELNLGRQVNLMKHGGKRNIDIDKESEVWVRSYRQGEPAWIKGTVLDRLGNQTFQIQTKGNQPWTRHNDQIWPIRKSTDGSVLKKVNPDPSDSPDVGDRHQPTPILDDLPNIDDPPNFDEPPNCDETPSINESPNATPMNRRSQRTRKKKVPFSP
ncbi:Integrase core domain [Nesidiocoris tenuis]|nr:Integrase core domain [Nesidiocoris tenuis]